MNVPALTGSCPVIESLGLGDGISDREQSSTAARSLKYSTGDDSGLAVLWSATKTESHGFVGCLSLRELPKWESFGLDDGWKVEQVTRLDGI